MRDEQVFDQSDAHSLRPRTRRSCPRTPRRPIPQPRLPLRVERPRRRRCVARSPATSRARLVRYAASGGGGDAARAACPPACRGAGQAPRPTRQPRAALLPAEDGVASQRRLKRTRCSGRIAAVRVEGGLRWACQRSGHASEGAAGASSTADWPAAKVWDAVTPQMSSTTVSAR